MGERNEHGIHEDPLTGRTRCWWCGTDPQYQAYHDNEWGQPVTDDTRLFEKICLEGFQSGLSWLTILRKRDAFRDAFEGFEFERVAHFDAERIEQLMTNAQIVRHRGKIQAAVSNAHQARLLAQEFGSLAAYFWSYEPSDPSIDLPTPYAEIRQRTQSESSLAMAKDLKRRGWRFVGPTTAYAFMQSMGLVNDHVEHCDSQRVCAQLRASLIRPG